MIDAAKRASAKRITAVCPFYAYARQDRKAEGREPITARLLADMLTVAGARPGRDRRPAHRPDPGFLRLPGRPSDRGAGPRRVSGARPARRERRDRRLARRRWRQACATVREPAGPQLDAEIAFIDKRRPKGTHNVALAVEVVGDIEGRTCVLVDDMIDTAGTIVSAANLLHDRGASDVFIAATHGIVLRPGRRPAEERADPGGHRDEHAAGPRRQALRRPSTVLSVAPLSPRPSTPSSTTLRSARSSAATTSDPV